jgi:hypothetical protein
VSINRDVDHDRAATRDVLAGQRPATDGVVNWLGHEIGVAAERIDAMLLTGATADQMAAARKTYRNHLDHLRDTHGLPVAVADGVYTFDSVVLGVLVPTVAARPILQPPTPAGDTSAAEGRELFRMHRIRERNRRLVALKKRSVLVSTGKLACEACGFDFAAVYGPRGDGFAECHHNYPISQSASDRRTRLSELAVVCANCHRMLHRRPWLSVAELRELVRSRRVV